MDGTTDIGVAHAGRLIALVDATIARDRAAAATARAGLVAAMGEAAMIDAAGVIGGFEGITRVADATGIPLEPAKAEMSAGWRETLGIDRFAAQKA